MKKIFLLFLAASCMFISSCGTSKKVNTILNPASFDSGMVEYGFAKSYDKSKAYRDALRDAQLNLATRLYRSLSVVDTEFGEDTQMGTKTQNIGTRAERIVGIIDDKVITIRNSKDPVFHQDSSSVYECEVVVILDENLIREVSKAVYDSLSDDDYIKIKFREEQFTKEYEKQLQEFRERQSGTR